MCKKIKLLGILIMLATSILNAQTENSPYSRYGLGDHLPSQNIVSRGLGGVSAGYADVISVNFQNPASYARLKRATFDFGLEIDNRTLKAINPPRKFSSTSPNISYVQLGLPLSTKHNWGMNIGLRPVTSINYKIQKLEKLNESNDSASTLFEGNGGIYEVYTGTGFNIKNLSLGFNVGYRFGTKDFSTKRFLLPSDTVFVYPSQYINNTNVGGLFVNGGLQYTIKMGKQDMLRLGAFGSMKRDLTAHNHQLVQTFQQNSTTNVIDSIDVISNTNTSGKITYPGTFGGGIMFYKGDMWLLGADFTKTKWSDYRYFGAVDSVQDAWSFHLGGQIIPNATNAKSYWGRVTYRAGLWYGRDYVKVVDDLPSWGLSIGFGLPMRPPSYSNQYSIINTAFEFGQRGTNSNLIKENVFKISIGLTLSDIWFIKKKYD
ncbi:MAG TPA: hypothetical protein VM101_02920 [Flavitalea sp.]|nr:hypothetical protein [Flavitalea sp.]